MNSVPVWRISVIRTGSALAVVAQSNAAVRAGKRTSAQSTWQNGPVNAHPLLPLLLACCASVAAGAPGVVINEVRQSDAEFVELHNPGAVAVDLRGYALTGDVRHSFERSTPLPAGGYLVLVSAPRAFAREFAGVPAVELAAGRLADRGGVLRFHDAAGALIDDVSYGEVGRGSLHRVSSTTSYRGRLNWRLGEPTPGRANGGEAGLPPLVLDAPTHTPEQPTSKTPIRVSVRVHDPQRAAVVVAWETRAGRFEAPLAEVSSTEGARVYAGEIPPQPGQILVRFGFVASREDGSKRRLDTSPGGEPLAVFVFDRAVKTRLPLFFIELPKRELAHLERKPQRGRFEASFVAVEGNRVRIFTGVTLAAQGDWTRQWDKKSWAVRFGAGQRFRRRKRILLRTPMADATHRREVLAYGLFRAAGVVSPQARPVRVHVNGQFYGLFTEVDVVDEGFLARNGLAEGVLYRPDHPDLAAVEHWCDGRAYPTAAGYETHWGKMTFRGEPHDDLAAFIRGYHDSPSERLEAFFARHLDVERYVSYLAVAALVTHWDSMTKNYYWCLDRSGSGKWTVIPWDLDQTWGYRSPGGWAPFEAPVLQGTQAVPVNADNRGWWNHLRDRFLSVPAHRRRLYQRILALLDTDFQPAKLGRNLEAWLVRSGDDILTDRLRWGFRSRNQARAASVGHHVRREVEFLKTYSTGRSQFLRKACQRGLAAD